MEISQIIEHIFKNQTNINALFVITVLTGLALFGTFKSENPKIKHFAKQSPAILATVGIFFSFWGISIGLIGLNLEDIQHSIPTLLEGLKAKFLASLMGIFASIIVRIAQSFSVEDSDNVSWEAEQLDLSKRSVALLAKINHVLTNNVTNNPEALLQELKQAIGELPIEFKKQNTLLDSIKSSLAGEGDASVTTQLSKLRMDMRDALSDMDRSNKQRSDSLNNTLTTNFDNLTQKFEDFAKIVAENNSKAFIEALEAAMRDFNNNITEQFGENFKELNRAVGELLTWQDKYKDHVEQMTSKFDIALKSVVEIQTAFGDIQTRSESFTQISTELSGVLEKLDVQLQSFDAYLKGIRLIADNAKEAFPTIEDNLNKLTSGFKKSTEQSLADINNTVESVGENLVETTTRLKDTTGKLRDSMENQRETLEKTSDEFKEVVGTTLKTLAKETKTSIDTYSESLQEASTTQLDSIKSNIKQSNATIAESIDLQEKMLVNVSQDVKIAVDRTLRDLSEQSKLSIREYENSLHNAVTTASKEFNRLLTENTTKSTNVLEQQTQLLDKALQDELKKAIETMGKHLAALSNQFVQDYRPLTDKLREVVKLAEDLKRGR